MNLIGNVWRAVLAAAPVKIWAQIGAAVTLSMMAFAALAIIWHGPWPSERIGQRLDLVFYLAVGLEVLVLVALAAITGLNVNLHGGKDGLHASIDQDEVQPLKVETTVATTVTPAQPATANDGELPAGERLQP